MEKSRVEWILRYGLGEVSTLPPRLSRIEELLVELIRKGSGSDITVDDELSPTSENPVQNKVLDSIINGTGSGSVYSKIMLAIAEVVAEAPEDFDTLKEISDWISHHEDSAAAMNTAIQANTTAIDGKVDKVSGKGLSTNDYTTEEKNKLASISVNASDVGQLYPDSNHGEIFNGYEYNVASGNYSHAEGQKTKATGNYSHAEGADNTASGSCSHAEGNVTKALGASSHAEGINTTAYGDFSHVEGFGSTVTADGFAAHAEGNTSTSSGDGSHAEGIHTIAEGIASHAEGGHTIAASGYQHVQGKWNKSDTVGKYAFILGNGTDDTRRSDAFAVDWNGLIYQNNSETGVDLNNKVDKVSGKRLSTEDYTTAEKTKLGNCKTVWEGTQAEYDALVSKTYDLYMIYEDDEEETEVENQNDD